MRSFRHWTPRYLVDRVTLMIHERWHKDAPWLTPASVRVLESWLRPEDRGLEWGSGRSTLWIARRIKWLVSVEHDEAWSGRVRAWISEHGIKNVEHRFCSDELSYLAVADEIPPGSLDFVLVDGIARDRCALIALSRLRPGGLLVIDNANWYLPCDSRAPGSCRSIPDAASHLWANFFAQTHDWRRIWTTNGITDTALFVKPGLPA
jgi:predicted O-methyltransferase YrrM